MAAEPSAPAPDRFSTHFSLVLVAWGALAFGAVYPWAYWPLAAGCVLLGLYSVRFGVHMGRWQTGLSVALLMIAAGIVIQLIPLSRGMLLTVSGATDAFLSEFRLGYAISPAARHPLSIDPSSTVRAAALFGALALFLIGLIRLLPHARLDSFVRGLLVFGVLFALFGIVQDALFPVYPRRIYGFWQPREVGNPFGSFVNRNHFAGWMLMALSLVLGYAFAVFERNRPRRPGWRQWMLWIARPEAGRVMLVTLCAFVMGTAIVVTGSRSGLISFGVAVIVATGFALPRVSSRSRRVLVSIGMSVLLFSAIAWGGVNATVVRFSTAPDDIEGRLTAWRDAARIVRDFPIVGTGLNTFGTAMLIYQTGDRRSFYREAHSDYLQLVAEGGVLLTLPAVVTLVVFARQVWRRFSRTHDDRMTYWIRAGAVAGLAGIATQSLFDFSLQMPGNAVLFVLLAAIAVHEPIQAGRRRSRSFA